MTGANGHDDYGVELDEIAAEGRPRVDRYGRPLHCRHCGARLVAWQQAAGLCATHYKGTDKQRFGDAADEHAALRRLLVARKNLDRVRARAASNGDGA